MALSLYEKLINMKHTMVTEEDNIFYLQWVHNTFSYLSNRMQNFHQAGLIPSINSKKIEEVANLQANRYFDFSEWFEIEDKDSEIHANIATIALLHLGIIITSSQGLGFEDYTERLSEKYNWVRTNFDKIEQILTGIAPDNSMEYFRKVLVNGENMYYAEYMDKKASELEQNNSNMGQVQGSQSQSKVLQYTNGKNTMMLGSIQEEQEHQNTKMAAFVNVIFYPTLLLVTGIILVVLYNCYLFLTK